MRWELTDNGRDIMYTVNDLLNLAGIAAHHTEESMLDIFFRHSQSYIQGNTLKNHWYGDLAICREV